MRKLIALGTVVAAVAAAPAALALTAEEAGCPPAQAGWFAMPNNAASQDRNGDGWLCFKDAGPSRQAVVDNRNELGPDGTVLGTVDGAAVLVNLDTGAIG